MFESSIFKPPEPGDNYGQTGSTDLGLFIRKGFIESSIGKRMYQGLDPYDPANYPEMYGRAYETFQLNQGKIIRIEEPLPTPPDQIEGEVTLGQLQALEGQVAILSVVGFSGACNQLGKNPLEEIEKEELILFL